MADDPDARPSRASMREVRREYKERRKADEQRAKDAKAYWAQQRSGGSPKRSSTRRGTAVVGAVAVVAAAIGGTWALHLGPFAGAAAAPGASTPTLGSTASPTTSPRASSAAATPAASDDGTDSTVHAAFDDSPARSWPTGSAGITTPKGRQVGIYRPVQVHEAYADVARYLTVALLDPKVTYRGALQPVFSTLGHDTVAWLQAQQVLGSTTKGKRGIGWDQVANRFRVGDWRAASEVRVKGVMKATQDTRGELVVHFVYVAAYWLVPAKGGAARTISIRRAGNMYFYGNGPSHVSKPSYGGSGYVSSASVCGSAWPYFDFVQAWVDPSSVTVVSPSPATSAYDPTDVNAPEATGCFTDTSGFHH